MSNATNLSSFIWSVADLLRGSYKQSDYGKVILPFTVLRRLDCILEPTKDRVLEEFKKRTSEGVDPTPFLTRIAKQTFYNSSQLDLNKALAEPTHIRSNLLSYINGFSSNIGDIFEKYEFDDQIDKLASADLLYLVSKKFAEIDLHPDRVSNADMGVVFEELIRKFAELSNETAGEHFTPREVIRLMVDLLFHGDNEALVKPGVIRTLYDPTAGTGGMLSIAEEYLTGANGLNPDATLIVSGQELNPESYAICKGDMLIKGQDVSNIKFGDTLKNDGHAGAKFDYGLSNPPFGVEWKKSEKEVKDEHERLGFAGRFGPGLPRISDGSLLFLLHLINKMREPEKGGGRIAIVLNGSPLFTGGAGSGESEIRKWIIEQDLLETIIGLPTDMFYNTGIATYIWVLSNHKDPKRKGKIQLIDATNLYQRMRKALGSKRKELNSDHISQIINLYGDFKNSKSKDLAVSKIFENKDFGYTTITVERPLLDNEGNAVVGEKGKLKDKQLSDPSKRDTENIPLQENIEEYFKREVPSLAKGLKNQLFREISDEIDAVIKQWIKYCKESKLDSSRLKWEKFCEGIDGVFGPFLIAKYRGGSKRKPYLCMATFENENRQYNSWNENCVFSRLLYFTNNPVWVESVPKAFSVSEHAIQRIFERSLTDESPREKNFRKVHFANELRFAPLWATFWVYMTTSNFESGSVESVEIVLPSPSGLFIGEIHKDSYCEIRTFLSTSQLSLKQSALYEKMLFISHKFFNSVIPFLFHKFITDQSGSMDELVNFLIATEEVTEILRTEFQIKI